MHLKQWAEHHRHSAQWIADQIGVNVSMVSRWLRGENLPSLGHANQIHRLTGGEVTALDWEKDPDASQPKGPQASGTSNSMEDKNAFVWRLAQQLASDGETMTGQELAEQLNTNGFLTSYGTPYSGGRGVYSLVRSAYYWLEGRGLDEDASQVAQAFVKADGTHAWG